MRDQVLLVCEGRQHLSMAVALGESLKNKGLQVSLCWRQPEINGLELIFKHIIVDVLAVPGFLARVGLVILFTHESSPFCMQSTRIGYIAKRTNTSCLTVQHGLIQPGLNFETSLQQIGFTGRNTDNSLAVHHFSDVVSYFGIDGIGYPLARAPRKPVQVTRADANVLIATNFNWGIYSNSNIVAFARAIRHFKQQFPSLKLRHRAHPAERQAKVLEGLGLAQFGMDVEVDNQETIDESLGWADFVITTPSTVALDAVARGRFALVFKPPQFAGSLTIFEEFGFFQPKELSFNFNAQILARNAKLPDIQAFDGEKFFSIVKQRISESGSYRLDEQDYIEYIKYVKI